MTPAAIKRALKETYKDVLRHHTFQVAAALAYYFVLAIFPLLILLSAAMSALTLPNLFAHVLELMSRLLPPSTVQLISSVLSNALASRHSTWISAGTLGLLWVGSAAFDALIEALDIAYDVSDTRSFWKTRLMAIGLSTVIGTFLATTLTVMILGPRFADWLAHRIYLHHLFVLLWPPLRWIIATGATVLAVETIYFLAPNVRQRFAATLPGATLAVGSWLGLSHLLGVYFRNFANYDLVYGTLGAFIAFMTWCYWTSFALLIGAELNAEMAKESREGQLLPKIPSPTHGNFRRAA